MNKFVLGLILFLTACTSNKTECISTNAFLQEDYEYMCLDGTKTFSQIIICYQAQDKAEKTQNKITNDLIKN